MNQLEETISELESMSYRSRTIYDYQYHMTKYIEVTGITQISEMNRKSILQYINHGNIKQSTKNIRLKLLKAFLNGWYSEGVIESKLWKDITVK